MDFNPTNHVVKRCLQAMALEEKGQSVTAREFFIRAWHEATNDFEKFLAAFYIARHQEHVTDRIAWLETTLQLALQLNNEAVKAAFPGVYESLAKCYEELGDTENAKKNYQLASSSNENPSDQGPFYHGSKANLQVGDLLTPGGKSNYKADLTMNHIYFTALANGAGLAAALAKGDGPDRVYIVEPTGEFENDPNVTNKKFPGNPTRSYRTASPLKIVGELKDWNRITPEELQQWRHKLANNKGEIIN